MRPLFSIITVTYNAAQTVVPTLKSVAEQTCTVYEHIIMDGASTDGTAEIAAKMATERTHIYSSPDKGIYDAMNKALAIAQGDYVLFLNAGDRLHAPDTLQLYADAIMDNDYPGVVFGQTNIIDSDGNFMGKRHLTAPRKLKLHHFLNGMVVCHQAFMVLKKIAPMYNTAYKYSSDYEWCIICLQHSRNNVYIPAVVADYLNEGLTTQNHKKSLVERFQIMRTYFGLLPTTIFHAKFLMRHAIRRILHRSPNKQ